MLGKLENAFKNQVTWKAYLVNMNPFYNLYSVLPCFCNIFWLISDAVMI